MREKGRGVGTLLSRSFIDNCLHLTMHSTDSSFVFFLYRHDWRWFHSRWDWHITNRKGQRSQRVATLKEARCRRHTHTRAQDAVLFVFSTSNECKRCFFQSVFFSFFFPPFAMITWPWSYRLALRFLDVSNKCYSEAMKFKCWTSPSPPPNPQQSHTSHNAPGGQVLTKLKSHVLPVDAPQEILPPHPLRSFQKLVFKIKVCSLKHKNKIRKEKEKKEEFSTGKKKKVY